MKKERNTVHREPFTPEASLQHNAARIDELVAALGKVLFFTSETAAQLGIQKQIAPGKLGLLTTLIEDSVRCIESYAFGEKVPTNFKQVIAKALGAASTAPAITQQPRQRHGAVADDALRLANAVAARRDRKALSASLIQ